MDNVAGLIAPIATMVAAMMTAANLGARVTGWGFVVFTAGSISWSIVGVASGQTNLVATNVFLTLVNLVGIWRWLGRQRVYEDGAKHAARTSRHASGPTLFPATALAGMTVCDIRGETLGKAIEAMAECASGEISYVVIASGGTGGIDETLRSVPSAQIDFHASGLILLMTRAEYERREPIKAGNWPGQAPVVRSPHAAGSSQVQTAQPRKSGDAIPQG